MIDPLFCPVCDRAANTERVHSETYSDTVEHVYICNTDGCGTQYTVTFEAFDKEIDFTSDDEEADR